MKENNNGKVTISFPIYNVESTIKNSLLSALNQTYENLEILAVDDCGTDKSVKIFKNIVSTHPRGNIVRLVSHGKNLGLGAVRNTSIEKASGNYIYFMDSDDLLYPNTIALLVNLLEENNVDFVTSSYVENRNGIKSWHRYSRTCCVKGRDIQIQQYKGEPVFVYMWNKLVRLDLLRSKNIRCVHPYVEDDMFTFNLLAASKSYCKCCEITYEYIIRTNSITNELMFENIPRKTAEIYTDIIRRKLEYTATLDDKEIASLISIYVLNSACLRLSQIERSCLIVDRDKQIIQDRLLKEFCLKNIYFSPKIIPTQYLLKYVIILLSASINLKQRKKILLNIQNMKHQ